MIDRLEGKWQNENEDLELQKSFGIFIYLHHLQKNLLKNKDQISQIENFMVRLKLNLDQNF